MPGARTALPTAGLLGGICNARLPAWMLPATWPQQNNAPVLADMVFDGALLQHLLPAGTLPDQLSGFWDAAGAPLLPPLIEPHVHLDKTFTVQRSQAQEPGLLAAISALQRDRQWWDRQDIQRRASRALRWAYQAGVGLIRSHIDWFDPTTPLAWSLIGELAGEQADCQLQRVALLPLGLYQDPTVADHIAERVAASGVNCLLGGFIHSSNWHPTALNNLLVAARRWQLDVDLHIDEELNVAACGVSGLADWLSRNEFAGHISCSHACALSVQPESLALHTLDQLARANVSLIALPMTNLLLQDAQPERTPRQRGITLIKEARARQIPLLLGADNVQDAFCPSGSYDPLDTLTCALFSAQLSGIFDDGSRLICDRQALGASQHWTPVLAPGQPVDLTLFPGSDVASWPLRSAGRRRVKHGILQPLAEPPGVVPHDA